VRPLARRTFLQAGGTALLGLAVACGKGSRQTNIVGEDTLNGLIGGRRQTLGVEIGLTETLARPNERMPVILHRPDEVTNVYRGGEGRLWIAEKRDEPPVLGPYELTWHDEGLEDAPPQNRGVYAARVSIPRDGSWLALVEASPEGASDTLVGGAQFGVGIRSNPPMPKPGERAISVASPTPDNHRGVEPYCTRKPPCSLHYISLDKALANKKPTVLIFATPQFCTSRTCGPEVDIVQAVWRERRASINFVHVEQFKDDKQAPADGVLSPASKAWRMEAEPSTYFIDAAGIIRDRFIGPAAVDEIRTATTALA
jgi:hypothetical protein